MTGSLDSNVRVWKFETGQDLGVLYGHTSLVGQLQIRNNILVSGGSDGSVRVWDLSSSGKEKPFRLPHPEAVNDAVFSPDGKLIASVGQDRRIRLWDASNGNAFSNAVGAHLAVLPK